jgi:hypothetical protein
MTTIEANLGHYPIGFGQMQGSFAETPRTARGGGVQRSTANGRAVNIFSFLFFLAFLDSNGPL